MADGPDTRVLRCLKRSDPEGELDPSTCPINHAPDLFSESGVHHPTNRMALTLARQSLALAHHRCHFVENGINHSVGVHGGQRLGASAHVGLELCLETELLHPLIRCFLPLNTEHHSLQVVHHFTASNSIDKPEQVVL